MITRKPNETDDELRVRIRELADKHQTRIKLREFLAKLGIKSARRPDPFKATIKVNGTTIAITNASYTISQDIKPIDVLGRFEPEEL